MKIHLENTTAVQGKKLNAGAQSAEKARSEAEFELYVSGVIERAEEKYEALAKMWEGKLKRTDSSGEYVFGYHDEKNSMLYWREKKKNWIYGELADVEHFAKAAEQTRSNEDLKKAGFEIAALAAQLLEFGKNSVCSAQYEQYRVMAVYDQTLNSYKLEGMNPESAAFRSQRAGHEGLKEVYELMKNKVRQLDQFINIPAERIAA